MNGQRGGKCQDQGLALCHIDNPFHRLFHSRRYPHASDAFLKAGRNREAAICDAYSLREKARLTSTTTSATRIQAFTIAAKAFSKCAQDSPSNRVNERQAYHGTAGECYSEARELKNAGDSYRMAERYPEAARTYREGGYFDEMVEVITQYGDTLDNDLLQRLMMVAQMHYFKVCFNASLFPNISHFLYVVFKHQVSIQEPG